MTDVARMSVSELVGKVLAAEHADVLHQAVCWLTEQLMEAEVKAAAGAGYGSAARSGRRATKPQLSGSKGSYPQSALGT
jgi:hypothetical protein